MAPIEEGNAYGCTLFLGQQTRTGHTAEFSGREAYLDGKLYHSPERQKAPSVRELARRTGVTQSKLEEAYGAIETYRLNTIVL